VLSMRELLRGPPLIAGIGLMVFAALLVMLVAAPAQPWLAAIDRTIPQLMRGPHGEPLGPDWFREAMRDVSALGSMSVLIGTAIVVALGWTIGGRMRDAARLVAVMVASIALNTAAKAIIARPRPDLFEAATQVFTNSFPSAHAMVSASLAVALVAGIRKPRAYRLYLTGIAILLTGLIGISRIYLGVHWPSDVIAGWALGLACAIIVLRLTRSEGSAGAPGG
jgi:undecaprenyl-diphosphatase